jgi:hypothetical protein
MQLFAGLPCSPTGPRGFGEELVAMTILDHLTITQ